MQSDGMIARVYSSRAGGTLFEQSLFVVWFLVIGLPIDAISPLRYLFILYFLLSFGSLFLPLVFPEKDLLSVHFTVGFVTSVSAFSMKPIILFSVTLYII